MIFIMLAVWLFTFVVMVVIFFAENGYVLGVTKHCGNKDKTIDIWYTLFLLHQPGMHAFFQSSRQSSLV